MSVGADGAAPAGPGAAGATSYNRVVSYKLVLLGDSAVGKSSSCSRFVKRSFEEHGQPTIGAAFLTQTVDLDGYTVKFEIWDTAGQERYRSLAPMYYRGAAAALIVYDITDHGSFEGAQSWISELQRHGSPDIVIGLAGNKSDLDGARKVTRAEAEAYAKENRLIFYETSAKTGANIDAMFKEIAKRLPKEVRPDAQRRSSVTLHDGSGARRASSSCC
ncbi:Ras family [Plasmodiophora brassicae]|uniref:Uncharacterized protein n=1 Tax=Plasmodiophora brassicae TaxID=37360 RepID=A0A0G4IWQ5_PLABS|nr:hypothetical protein PBRA_007385 [Plasmodiophora brassicae]SPQ98015.1 unnamed protein product [Plasmodiophora brassicae]